MDVRPRQALALIAGLMMFSSQSPADGYYNRPMHVPEGSPIRRRLIEPGGPYKGREVVGEDGQQWLGLMRTASGYRLARVTLRIAAVIHETEGYAGGPPTGKLVMIAEPGDPLFLLRGFAELAGRTVPTVFDGKEELSLENGFKARLGSQEIELTVASSGRFEPGLTPQDPKVQIFQVNIRRGRVLTPLPLVVTESNGVYLRWAGDLDGDGRVDYLFQDGGYNWESLRLFLSSAAKPGQVVAEVAQFYHTGC